MKKITLSMAVIASMSMFTSLHAQSLAEALKDGKISGEVTTTYENRGFDKNNASTYYQDTSYAVGSFALKYESAEWNDLSLTAKFRAYKTLFEDNDNLSTWKGTGDASERFWQKDGNGKAVDRSADIEELFITYAPNDNFSIKSGRQFISSHWVNKTNDAVKIDASFGDTALEAIWVARHGRIYARDYRPMTKANKNDGVYQFALSHKFNDMLSVTAYDRIEEDKRDILGGKVNTNIAGYSFGAHYASSDEDPSTGNKDSNLLHLTASTSIAGFTPYVGYIKVDDDAAFPGWTSTGETIDPFEEGDYIYNKGAETMYVGVSKSFGELSSTLLYGTTEYLDGSTKRDMDETTLWLGYPITKDVKANLGYTVVNEVDTAVNGDYNQLNLTLTYSF